MTSKPQQSSPSKLQNGLLFTSSQEPSDIQAVFPVPFTEIISYDMILIYVIFQKIGQTFILSKQNLHSQMPAKGGGSSLEVVLSSENIQQQTTHIV